MAVTEGYQTLMINY